MSIAVELLLGVYHSSATVNGERLVSVGGSTLASAVATHDAVLELGVQTDVIVGRHDAVDAEPGEVGARQARHAHAVLVLVEEARPLVVDVLDCHDDTCS